MSAAHEKTPAAGGPRGASGIESNGRKYSKNRGLPPPSLEKIEDALRFVPPAAHDLRDKMAKALKSELGEAGFDIWDRWYRGHERYSASEARDVWKSNKAGEVRIGTLLFEAKARGWRDDGRFQESAPEEIQARREAAEAARREAEGRPRERAKAAALAGKLWEAASQAQADHPYLERKRVQPTDRLRELDAGQVAAIIGYAPKYKGEPLAGRALLAPVEIWTPEGPKVSTLELIDEAGRKSALAGGAKSGGWWAAQGLPEGDGEGLKLLIGEGVATVLSASQASGFPVLAALSAGNLPKVAQAMRARYPAAALALLADLVKADGAPDPHAVQAARAAGGVLAVPAFQEGHGPGRKDFNDLLVAEGADAVRAIILEALAGAGGREHREHGFHLATSEKALSPPADEGGEASEAGEKFFSGVKTSERRSPRSQCSHDPEKEGATVGATGPETGELAAAVAFVESCIAACADDPGKLASEAFNEAARLVRERDPEEWFRLRVAIKRAKPSGVLLGDIDQATRPPGAGEEDGTVADELVEMVISRGELFHDPEGSAFFAERGTPAKTFKIGAKAFAEWLSYAFYMETKGDGPRGRAASETAIKTAIVALTGVAKHDGAEKAVFLRAAPWSGGYLVDLCDETWRVAEVSPTGWRVLDKSPVPFWRPAPARPLPIPAPGGDLDRLWEFANVPADCRPLVMAWLLEAWRPDTPFPILELAGQQGTAKSSSQDKLRRVIDPSAVNLRAAPKSVEDIFVGAGCNWLVSFNNLSHLSAQQQDALCNLATGGGFAARTLYTNGDETIIECKRPVVINGIAPTVTAQDLADRVIHVELPVIEYREETELEAAFAEALPAILGGLLDSFAKTLAKLPEVKLERLPRMGDYARLGEAMMRAQGHEAGKFAALYETNRRDSVARGLDASPVAAAVREMAEASGGRLVFEGTMKSLLERLKDHRNDAEAWPKSPRGLGDALRRQRPALAQVGIDVTIGKAGREGVNVAVRKREHCEGGERRSEVFTPEKNFSDAETVVEGAL
jgi:phage/plasmid primase-like uncharacterized protein